MNGCTLYNGLKDCRTKVFSTDCPGIKLGKCVSKHGQNEKIPAVCGLFKGLDKCLFYLEENRCPGKKEDSCVSIEQTSITSTLPNIRVNGKEVVPCGEVRTYKGCLTKINKGKCLGQKEGQCISKYGHTKEIPTSSNSDMSL